jgi:hypothetical protein
MANGGCKLRLMARAREPSAATQKLADELAARGLNVGCRSIEAWGIRGLAPPPARVWLGRGRGTTSAYPPGAVEQYAAVASVMRRGLPWQIAVLKLLVRGYLPADEDLVRVAFHDLLAADVPGPGEDALGCAERIASRVVASGSGQPFLRAFRRNLLRSAAIFEPGSEIGAAVAGVVATLNLAVMGEPDWSEGALAEMMAAFGIPVGAMTDDDRAALTRFADIYLREIMPGPVLVGVAAEAPMSRIQGAVPRAREAAGEIQHGSGEGELPPFSEDIADVVTACMALVLIRIEDLGGDDVVAEILSRAMTNPAGTPPALVTPEIGPSH